ncbi:hypothetical protein PCASD_17319 [Puccinia coronata f. sp. avenae]|uniref:RRM domain-containing protein n=1 Tax=Puccinia coronata f. sp. avenae TaxID=200324 RepID=A0A2N5U2M0_9BASI|nr:hypothetical protein PCASD_17319 [Puccinia coronata f. sp. avenae]
MHCSELNRHTITMEEYDDCRDRSGRGMMGMINSPHSKLAQAAPFVPATLNPNSSSSTSLVTPTTSKWESPQTLPISEPTSLDACGGGGGAVQKQVDPCNLFIKGLSLEVESGDLFHPFKQFGTIVLARVMTKEATGTRLTAVKHASFAKVKCVCVAGGRSGSAGEGADGFGNGEAGAEGLLEQLVKLLMALPARDRKLCLFNPQVLATGRGGNYRHSRQACLPNLQ